MTHQAKAPLAYTEANLQILEEVFHHHNTIQSFINWEPQWSDQKSKWLKRPIQKINNPFQHLTLTGAAKQSSHLGLVCSDAHPIIALDVDGVSLATPSIAKLLHDHPTYVEQSPSGMPDRLRVLYALPTVADKDKLRKKGSCCPPDQPSQGTFDLELYNLSTNFVTLTGQALPGYPHSITTIEPAVITEAFPTFVPPSKVVDIGTRQESVPNTAQLVPFSAWLSEVPCARDDPSLQAFLGKHSLIYHDYWLIGLMSIHAAFGPMQGYSVADTWSRSSGDDYDEEELSSRWTSISEPDYDPELESQLPQDVTMATYQWMFNEFSIQWPVCKGKSKIPKADELENFLAFLKYKGLTPETDTLTGTVFLDGADYALYPTYYESKEEAFSIDTGDLGRLSTTLVMEAMPYKFRPSTAQVVGWLTDLISYKKGTINRFAREITRLPAYDPSEPDYLKVMGRDIIQRNTENVTPSQEFHELIIYKWMLSLGRNLWPELTQLDPKALSATSEGVLILSSPKGGINKSSFGVRMFPREWQHLHVTTKPRLSGQFADKDSVQKTVGRLIVDFDEAERIFSHNDTADLKAYLTERYDMFRPPYGRDQQKHKRYFSTMASTNLTDLVFPKEGARRYWWVNVDYVDTYAMDKMNMYNVWRQILYELKKFKGKRAPYILTTAETQYLENYLTDHRSTNSLEDTLYDLYDFSDEGFAMYTTGQRMMGIKDLSQSVTEILKAIAGSVTGPLNRKALGHALQSLLKQHAPEFYVNTKLIKGGHRILRRQHRYFMPALRNDALKRAQEEDMM